MTSHLSRIREIIAAVRARDVDGSVKVLVGGYPFSFVDGLWKEIGADGTGRSAVEAVEVGNRLVDTGN